MKADLPIPVGYAELVAHVGAAKAKKLVKQFGDTVGTEVCRTEVAVLVTTNLGEGLALEAVCVNAPWRVIPDDALVNLLRQVADSIEREQ